MHLEPYLVFGGHCEEALNFYKQVFNGEIEGISRWSEMPTDVGRTPVTPETANRVTHANFKSPGVSFMASDGMPDKTYGEGPISLRLRRPIWPKPNGCSTFLAAGGNVEVPMQDMFWGAKFGMLTDKFGIDWMVSCRTS